MNRTDLFFRLAQLRWLEPAEGRKVAGPGTDGADIGEEDTDGANAGCEPKRIGGAEPGSGGRSAEPGGAPGG